MNIGKKVNEIFHNSKMKTIGTIVASIATITAISGCASQGNRAFEFSLFNGRYGARGQTMVGKDAPNPQQEIFTSGEQLQPYAVETFRHYPASTNGMKEAYQKR